MIHMDIFFIHILPYLLGDQELLSGLLKSQLMSSGLEGNWSEKIESQKELLGLAFFSRFGYTRYYQKKLVYFWSLVDLRLMPIFRLSRQSF